MTPNVADDGTPEPRRSPTLGLAYIDKLRSSSPAHDHLGVGKLLYSPGSSVDIEDRLLAHVRVVMMNMLRCGESFMLHVPAAGGGTHSVWISPGMALALQFHGSRAPELDRDLIDDMMRAASGAEGLTITNRV